MTAAPRVRALSIHADYGCRHAGVCCSSGWEIPVEPETEARLRAALRSGALPANPTIPPTGLTTGRFFRRVERLPHGARVVLATDGAGVCGFRGRGRCAVHGQLGAGALPSACRHFPRVVTLTPLGASVTLSHYCPTAAALLFRDDVALEVTAEPPAFPPSRPYEGLDARGALPPLLRPGVLMDWPGLERWERFAVSVLAEDERAPEAALDVLAAVAEHARRWTPERGAFGPFFEGALDATLGPGSPRDPAGKGSRGVQAWRLVAGVVPLPHLVPPAPEGLGDADARWVAPAWPAFAPPVRRWLAAKAFASWIALQGNGLRTTVLGLRVALGVLRAESVRGCAEAGRVLDAGLLKDAVRRADRLLVHLADPGALARRLSRCEASR